MSAQQFSDRAPSAIPTTLERSLACEICHAVYVPAQDHRYLAQAPQGALEAALMSMCHFCFRCRRPSCPMCWDQVHGVCASCVQEMRLPFRQELPPLSGTLFPLRRHAQEVRDTDAHAPLTCIRPGLFQRDEHAAQALEEATTGPVQAVAAHAEPRQLASTPPADGGAIAAQVAGRAASLHESEQDIATVRTRPERSRSGRNRFERLVTVVLLVIFLLVVALIVAASISARADALIAAVLHIDIRAEIAYLWQLITHLFS